MPGVGWWDFTPRLNGERIINIKQNAVKASQLI